MPAIIAQTIDLSQWTPRENGEVWGTDKNGVGGRVELMLESFETDIYVVRPEQANDWTKYLFNQYPAGDNSGEHSDPGVITYDNLNAVSGSRSILLTMTDNPALTGDGAPACPYLQCYTYTSGNWRFIQDIVDNYLSRGPWEFGKYNRFDVWVKTPDSLSMAAGGVHNASFGTYTSSRAAGGPESSNAERGGDHGYHRFNIPGGCWVKLQVDQHADHWRGRNGAVEFPNWGDINNPGYTNEPGLTYFDTFTRFYLAIGEQGSYLSEHGTLWNFDAFRFWQQENAEEEDKIRNVSIGVRASDNRIFLNWRRNKDENATIHEVRYSFFNPHSIGWENCLPAPGDNTVTRSGWQGYNGMEYTTDAINWTGQSRIYFAIKANDGTLMKTISYDLVMARGM